MTITIEEIKLLCNVCCLMLVLVSMVIAYMSGKLRATMTEVKELKRKTWESKKAENEEVLTIAYDSGDKDNRSCLVVVIKKYDDFIFLNEFYGSEADELYHKLVNKEEENDK